MNTDLTEFPANPIRRLREWAPGKRVPRFPG
jgi:hypothetical protein